ncbi:flippase-like domain-containing protein, partial [Prochlorococcus sp. AH-716-K03]|nr:flippase-like domain-containing protein [Prochlorococcus sp. AH-716-K03]
GILSWIFEGMSLWILVREISNFKISLLGSTIAHTLAGIIGVFSMIPGGLGTTEFSLVNFLYFQGLSIDVASSSTIIIRLMTIWFATFLGFIALSINRLKN